MNESIKITEGYKAVWTLPQFGENPQTLGEEIDRRGKIGKSIVQLIDLTPTLKGKEIYAFGRPMAGEFSGEEGIFRGIVEGEVGTYFCFGGESFSLSSLKVIAGRE